MNNKKAIIAMPMIITTGILTIALLGLLIWFGFKISDGLVAMVGFMKDYGLWVLVGIFMLVFWKQLRMIANFLLSKIGIKM